MEESNQTSTSSSPPPPSSMDREASGAASSSSNPPPPPSSSSSSSQVQEEEEDRYRDRVQREQQDDPQFRLPEMDHHNQHFGFPFRASLFTFDDSVALREDTWSCVIVVLTFWFFVSMTMILGVYGPVGLKLGPYCSVLIQPNPWFVQSIKVERLDDANPGLMLYGFYRSPPLNVVRTWSKTQNVSVPADSHKEWAYFLNKGSHINISYVMNSTSSSVFLIIAEGNEDLAQWLQDPTYPNTTLSWNVIHGTGIIQQNISQSSSYYVALGNLNSEDVEVKLTLGIRSLLYNTSEAYTKCTFRDGSCSVHILFRKGDAVVLTSPGPEKGSVNDEWYVKLSYGPRWVTYVVGIAGLTFFMLVVFNFLNKFRCSREEGTMSQFGTAEPERSPLLANKDDDLSSWGSSYDSLSNGEEDLDNLLAAGTIEGKPSGDGENGNSTRRLCAICFDAPRDCFFLPCGHCVACFDCGTRIAEAAGTCPICRRNMKKVRKIFTV